MTTTTAPKWRKNDTGFRSDDGFTIVFVGLTWYKQHKMYNLFAPNGKRIGGGNSSLADAKAITCYYRNNPEEMNVDGDIII
jgi:hypothetical protein